MRRPIIALSIYILGVEVLAKLFIKTVNVGAIHWSWLEKLLVSFIFLLAMIVLLVATLL